MIKITRDISVDGVSAYRIKFKEKTLIKTYRNRQELIRGVAKIIAVEKLDGQTVSIQLYDSTIENFQDEVRDLLQTREPK